MIQSAIYVFIKIVDVIVSVYSSQFILMYILQM